MNNRVVKNASWIVVANIVRSIIGFIIALLTARYLGPSNYGLLNYASSIVAFFVPIATIGLTNVLVQEFVDHPNEEGKILGTSLFLSSVSSVACIFGVLLFCYYANPGETDTIIVCLLYSVLLVFQALEITKYWFQSKLLAKYSKMKKNI